MNKLCRIYGLRFILLSIFLLPSVCIAADQWQQWSLSCINEYSQIYFEGDIVWTNGGLSSDIAAIVRVLQ